MCITTLKAMILQLLFGSIGIEAEIDCIGLSPNREDRIWLWVYRVSFKEMMNFSSWEFSMSSRD